MNPDVARLCGLSTLALSIFAFGCGEAVQSDFRPPLVTFHGRITGTVTGVVHPLHVALLWERADGGNTPFVVQETPIEPIFPARFTLNVSDPPPEAAMHVFGIGQNSADPRTARVAFGHFVVYEDLNGNNRFDLIPAGASKPVDRLLSDGDNARLSVNYFEAPADEVAGWNIQPIVDCTGPCPQPEPLAPVPGFNVFRDVGSPLTGDGCVEKPCRFSAPYIGYVRVDVSDIELPLTEPRYSPVQCEAPEIGTLWSPSPDNQCPGGVVPSGWGVLCADDNWDTYFTALSPQDPTASVCAQYVGYCSVSRDASGPPPADWPCQDPATL